MVTVRRLVSGAFILVSLTSVGHERRVHAQTDAWSSPYELLLTPARALAFMQAAERHLDFVPGEVLVRFKDGVGADGQERALTALRSRPTVSSLKWVGEVALLRDQLEWNADILSAQLSTQQEVAWAEPNYLSYPEVVPNDPGYSMRQWNFTALDMPRAWDINPGGSKNLTIASVDSGITTVNQTFVFPTWNGTAIQNFNAQFRMSPDFANGRLVNQRDFVFWNGPVLDMDGHGTHTASTVGEDTNNNLAEAGIAYNVQIMPIKVCLGYWEIQFIGSASGLRGFAPPGSGGCPTDAEAQGIRYAADSGAKVINLSLGSTQPSATLQSALSYAVSKGAFIAISGGNNHDQGNAPNYPANYAADIDGVMSVGAVGQSLTRAYYSNTSSRIEIAAPGGNDRDGGFNGEIWQMTIYPPDSDSATVLFPRFDRYIEWPYEGTSMAAPHVAGTAALIMSQRNYTPAVVEALIKQTARDLGPPGRDDEYGYGLVQPRAALFGFGITR
jgi:serine protease